jgi:hypothetical protein
MSSGLAPAGEVAVLATLVAGAYVSLHVGTPGVAPTTGNEVTTTGSGYSRQTTTFSNAGSNPTVASNAGVVTWSATSSWGTVNQFGVWDAVSGGNLRGWADLTTPKAVNSGDTARFAVGTLTVSAD